MAAQAIRSLLLVPVLVEGACWGFIGFDDCVEDRQWSEGEIDALKAAASGLGAAILRQRVDDALRRLQAFNEELLLNMAEGIVVDDADGRIIFANPVAIRTLGYPQEELLGLHWSDYIPFDQQDKVRQANVRRARGELDVYEIDVQRKGGERLPVLEAEAHASSGGSRWARWRSSPISASASKPRKPWRSAPRADRALRDLARHHDAARGVGSAGADRRGATSLVGVPLGGLYLMRPDGQSLEMVVALGLEGVRGKVLQLGEGLSGRVALTGEPMMVADYATWECPRRSTKVCRCSECWRYR